MTTSIQLLLCVQANICRAREDPSVFPRQPRSAADGGSGRRTMSHFAHGSGAARAAGEAGRRLLGPSSFPTTCRREPGLRLPAAVLSLCSSDCDVARRRWEEKKKKPTTHIHTHNSKVGARDSPGFCGCLANVRHWKEPLPGGATLSSTAEAACHSRPGRLRTGGRAQAWRVAGKCGWRCGARGAGSSAPAPSFPFPRRG